MVVYASKGASAPLDDLIKRDKWDKASIFPSAYETMTWNGRVWGMMQHPDIVFMWYATGLLKENGVDPAKLPMTWQDLDVAAQKATRKQGDGFDSSGSLRILALTGRSSLPNQTGRNWSPMMARLCSSTHQKWSRPSSGSRAT
jgi:ABC-type glycerol-3-phosphate transport system substrate-binding protein